MQETFMNVSHLRIKFATIEKRRLRLHFLLSKLRNGPPKPSVDSPEVTPEPGAFKHV
jgi:hypothetical protein